MKYVQALARLLSGLPEYFLCISGAMFAVSAFVEQSVKLYADFQLLGFLFLFCGAVCAFVASHFVKRAH